MPKIKSRRQLRADRKRLENLKSKEHEAAELKANAARLRSMSSSFSHGVSTGRSSGRTMNVSATPRNTVLSPKTFVRETPSYPSLVSVSNSPVKVKKRLSPEMEEREKVAQEETARKKKRVAVLCNKGAYQYISDETDLTTLGSR